MANKPIVILGGGVAGLTAAYELSKNGENVVVLEKQSDVGGALNSEKMGKSFVEIFYHHIFTTDNYFIELSKELGVEDEIKWGIASTAFLYKNETHKLSAPQDIFFFKPLSFSKRLKLARFLIKIKKEKNSKKYDNTPVDKWFTENTDKQIFDTFFKPLLEKKFGQDMTNVSAAWFIDRIKLRTNRNFRGEKIGYYKGGFREFLYKILEGAERNGCKIITNATVKELKIKNNKIESVFYNNSEIKAKAVISTVQPSVLEKFFKTKNNFTKKLSDINHQGSICILLGLKKSVSSFYWTNIIRDDINFGAIVEHTNFQPIEDYGMNLVYLASYPDKNSKLWGMSEEEIFNIYFSDLVKLFPHIQKSDIIKYIVSKSKNVGLVYELGILSKLLDYKTPIKNLFLGGMFNSYPDRSINLSIEKGKICAELARKRGE